MPIYIRNIIRSGIQSINPDTPIVIVRIQGYTVAADGGQVPNELTPEPEMAQIQPIQTSDLEHINNYNSAKKYEDLWIEGNWNALNRAEETGGDLIYYDGFEWLVHSIPEKWARGSNWTRVRVIQQKLATAPDVP